MKKFVQVNWEKTVGTTMTEIMRSFETAPVIYFSIHCGISSLAWCLALRVDTLEL